ncbi:MAG: tetraacyldisaccharide 4'-kinase [Pseudomonadota bacterium]
MLLWLPSLLFRTIAGIRRILYAKGILPSYRSSLPIIVVGNISVGGSGKTPFSIALLEELKTRGYKPGVVSRGYKSNLPQKRARLLDNLSRAAEVGDEPLLIYRRTKVPVVVAQDRSRAVRRLEKLDDCDVVVSDDGLQHYAMQRDIEIVCIDSESGLGNGWTLPAGPLREPEARLAEVDFVVLKSAGDATSDYFCLDGDTFVSLDDASRQGGADIFAGQTVHAVSGIAQPNGFFRHLESLGVAINRHAFPDHHSFSAEDFVACQGAPIVMTEKDAVKCAALNIADVWYLPVSAQVKTNVLERVIDRLDELAQIGTEANSKIA